MNLKKLKFYLLVMAFSCFVGLIISLLIGPRTTAQASRPVSESTEPKLSKDEITQEMKDEAVLKVFPHLKDHSRIAHTCVECHEKQVEEVSTNLHGKTGLLSQMPTGSLCLTCHESNHIVTSPKRIRNYKLELLQEEPGDIGCARCHSDPILATAYDLPVHVPGEFEISMHYRKAKLGMGEAPLCADCHGGHVITKIRSPGQDDYDPAVRTKVCAQCHIGGNENFSLTFDHKPITWAAKPLEFITITAFKVLTLGTFFALALYMLFDGLAILREKLFSKENEHEDEHEDDEFVERMNLSFRIQHFLMFASVITLVVTGWTLLAPESPQAQWLISLCGGGRGIGLIHRIAGIILMLDFVYHLIYLAYKFIKGAREFPMLPMPKDLFDVIHMVLYFFNIKKRRPDFEALSFFEKFDYWAVFWGVAMMGGSGLALMFPVEVTKYLPYWIVNLSAIVHADEALLAAVVLFIWHFWNVHLKPGVFPMNWAWLTGRMKKHHYIEEHRAHVERLKKQGKWK